MKSVKETATTLETSQKKNKKQNEIENQISLFEYNYEGIIEELKNINLNTLTPMEAMNRLYAIANESKN